MRASRPSRLRRDGEISVRFAQSRMPYRRLPCGAAACFGLLSRVRCCREVDSALCDLDYGWVRIWWCMWGATISSLEGARQVFDEIGAADASTEDRSCSRVWQCSLLVCPAPGLADQCFASSDDNVIKFIEVMIL
jgi:hypothetical protein